MLIEDSQHSSTYCEIDAVPLHQVSQFGQQSTPLRRIHPSPHGAQRKSETSSLHCLVDISLKEKETFASNQTSTYIFYSVEHC